MKYNLRFIAMIGLLTLSLMSLGQSTPNVSDFTKSIEVLPPSPNAFSLSKYGGLDLSLASGMANINIQLLKYESNNIVLPVSLAYSSNGLRVDELAGRVGVGWALNAGGVITRTVNGTNDESNTRITPPANFPSPTIDLRDFLENLSGDNTGTDGEPDLFSFNFNGYSGKFILDSALKPVLLEHSNIKIENDFSSTDWNFKVTTGDGMQYFFGGDAATEKTKKTTVGAGCGKAISAFIPTAWYLKRIVHPNADVVTFSYAYIGTTYTTGITESIYERDRQQHPSDCIFHFIPAAPVLNNTICDSRLQTSGVYLSEINSTSGTKVKFTYSDRNDGDDKILNLVEVFQPGNPIPLKSFSLIYTYSYAANFRNSYSSDGGTTCYRPFLTTLVENGINGGFFRSHKFAYNDINGLPPRLSFAQDHFGFFNGKDNTTLIPVPSTMTWQQKLPLATANRDVDPLYSQKGLLTSIIYPTGGKDSLVYESNQVYKEVTTFPPITV